jgi:hypothetical protein
MARTVETTPLLLTMDSAIRRTACSLSTLRCKSRRNTSAVTPGCGGTGWTRSLTTTSSADCSRHLGRSVRRLLSRGPGPLVAGGPPNTYPIHVGRIGSLVPQWSHKCRRISVETGQRWARSQPDVRDRFPCDGPHRAAPSAGFEPAHTAPEASTSVRTRRLRLDRSHRAGRSMPLPRTGTGGRTGRRLPGWWSVRDVP